MKKIYIILCLFTIISARAQQTWDKTYTDHWASSISETYNNNYVFAGAVYLSMSFRWNITKLNSTGNIIRDTVFVHGHDGWVNCIKETPDSGYIISGQDTSAWILRFDKNDHLLWNKYFSDYKSSTEYLINTSDNGHIIIGNYYTANMDYDILLMKINDLGNLVWTKKYSNGPYIVGTSLIEAYGGGYMCICNSPSGIWLYKINEQGDTSWTKKIGIYNYDKGSAIIKTTDNCYLIGGNHHNSGLLFIKIDQNGNIIWNKTYGYPVTGWESYCNSIITSYDNGFIAACYSREYPYGNFPHAWIIKLNSSGNRVWSVYSSYTSTAEDIIKTSDNKYILAGTKNGGAWVKKFDTIPDFTSGYDNELPEAELCIYPNPAYDKITINLHDFQNLAGLNLQIFNIHGQLFLQQTLSQNNTQIDISQLQSGVYIAKIRLADGSIAQEKLVVVK